MQTRPCKKPPTGPTARVGPSPSNTLDQSPIGTRSASHSARWLQKLPMHPSTEVAAKLARNWTLKSQIIASSGLGPWIRTTLGLAGVWHENAVLAAMLLPSLPDHVNSCLPALPIRKYQTPLTRTERSAFSRRHVLPALRQTNRCAYQNRMLLFAFRPNVETFDPRRPRATRSSATPRQGIARGLRTPWIRPSASVPRWTAHVACSLLGLLAKKTDVGRPRVQRQPQSLLRRRRRQPRHLGLCGGRRGEGLQEVLEGGHHGVLAVLCADAPDQMYQWYLTESVNILHVCDICYTASL